MNLPPLPPPPFPTRFTATEEPPTPSTSTVTWPVDDTNARVESAERIAWRLKTDQEQYLLSLETKLKTLPATSTSKSDSGYAGSHSSPDAASDNLRIIHQELLEDHDEDYSVPEDTFEAGHPEAEEEDDDEDEATREGRSLLSRAVGPAITSSLKHQFTNGKGQVEETPGHSPSKGGSAINLVVIPPTPSSQNGENIGKCDSDEDRSDDEDDEEDAIQQEEEEMSKLEFNRRRPSILSGQVEEAAAEQPRRISFSSSVRISGGIKHSRGRSSRNPNVRPSIPSDMFTPIPVNGVMSAEDISRLSYMAHPLPRNASLSQSSRNSSRANSPSRPLHANSILRTVSSSSSLGLHQQQSTTFVFNGASSVYSSSVPSRSSSPCSSIYAPLKRPSETCPSPMSVKPPVKKISTQRGEGKRTASGISFREFLRINGLSAREDDDDDDEEDEERLAGIGYRELVEEQRKRKERFQRKRHRWDSSEMGTIEETGFWGRVLDMMSINGRSGVGRGSAGRLIDPNSGSTNSGYGTIDGAKSVRRQRSSLSISSSIEGDHDRHDANQSHEIESDGRRRATRQDRVKSEVEVRFGPAPARWITFDWVKWKLKQIGGACAGIRQKPRRAVGGSAIDSSEEDDDENGGLGTRILGRSQRKGMNGGYQRV